MESYASSRCCVVCLSLCLSPCLSLYLSPCPPLLAKTPTRSHARSHISHTPHTPHAHIVSGAALQAAAKESSPAPQTPPSLETPAGFDLSSMTYV